MKTILTALLAFVCLQASSQCAYQTVINNATFSNVVLSTSNTCVCQQLNMPLVAGVSYTFNIALNCSCTSTASQGCIDGMAAQCQIYAGYSCCNQSELVGETGNSNYNGANSFTFTPNANYTYISVVYYFNPSWGCAATITIDSFSVASSATPLTASTQLLRKPCYGDSTGEASVYATGYSPFTYHWSDGQTNSTLQGVPANTYYVTVKDSTGCIVSDSIVLGSFPFTTASINYSGNTLTVTPENSYQWYFNGSIISGATNQTYTPTQNGDYYVVVIDANGCTLQSNTIYVGNAITCTTPFVFIYPPSESICSGGSQTLTLIGNSANYSWSNGSMATQITVSPTSTTTYSVTATDGNCSASASAQITVTTSPSFGIYPVNPVICSGIPINISVSASGTAYTWSGPNNFTANTAAISINTIGQYDITVTNPSGCIGTFSNTINVTQGVPPTISAGNNQTINLGDTTNLIATASNGTPPYSYAWSSNPVGFTSSLSNPQIMPVITTTYNLTVTEIDGCAATASTTVNISTTSSCDTSYHPVITASDCSLAIRQFYGAAYQWEQNGVAIQNDTTAFCNVVQTDYYTCKVEIGNCTYYTNNAYFVYNQGNCSTTAIDKVAAINNFNVKPNPSSGEFILSFEIPGIENVELKVFNTIGHLVSSENFISIDSETVKQINLQSAAQGIYIVQLTAGDKRVSRRIIVE